MNSPINTKSNIWKHFNITNLSESTATCTICDKPVERNNGTTNLWVHLENRHPIIFKQLKAGSNENELSRLDNKDRKLVLHSKPDHSKSTIDRKIAEMLIIDKRPCSFVEGKGFRALIKHLVPTYEVPSVKYFKEYINNMYRDRVLIQGKRIDEYFNKTECQ